MLAHGCLRQCFPRGSPVVEVSARCAGAASFGYRCGMGRHSSLLAQRPSQEHLHLGVDAAKLVVGPADERVVDGRIEAKQDLPALAHVYSEPAFTTGDGGWSPHSTTIRLLTMAAFRSSSRVTTPFSVSRLSAISTIPTAPSTIRERAATTALACWRRSIAWAISGA